MYWHRTRPNVLLRITDADDLPTTSAKLQCICVIWKTAEVVPLKIHVKRADYLGQPSWRTTTRKTVSLASFISSDITGLINNALCFSRSLYLQRKIYNGAKNIYRVIDWNIRVAHTLRKLYAKADAFNFLIASQNAHFNSIPKISFLEINNFFLYISI